MLVSHETGRQGCSASLRSAAVERRRSPRISSRIPVTLVSADARVPATAVDISRHGAGLLSPVAVRPLAVIWIQHGRTRAWARVRLVRASTEMPNGLYELGIEFLDDATGSFWGDAYD